MNEENKTKKVASTDKTYCVSKDCAEKCWRNVENYIFSEEALYSFSYGCVRKKVNNE